MYCEGCGVALANDARYCRNCGRPTDSGAATLPTTAATPRVPSSSAGPVEIPRDAVAPIWRRLVSWTLDAVLVYAFLLPIAAIMEATTPDPTYFEPDPMPTGIGLLVMGVGFLGALAYPIFFEGAEAGQTPGMRALGLRLVREQDGRPLGARLATGRVIALLANFFGLGLVVALFDHRRRTLRDLVSGTLMVRATSYPPAQWPGRRSWTGDQFRPVVTDKGMP